MARTGVPIDSLMELDIFRNSMFTETGVLASNIQTWWAWNQFWIVVGPSWIKTTWGHRLGFFFKGPRASFIEELYENISEFQAEQLVQYLGEYKGLVQKSKVWQFSGEIQHIWFHIIQMGWKCETMEHPRNTARVREHRSSQPEKVRQHALNLLDQQMVIRQ